jgi:P27 family predicted phage terminase small subunit
VLSGEKECRINRDEPVPGEGRVAAPAGMTEGARKVWDDLAPDLADKGCLTPWDVYTFEVFCESVAHYRECRDLNHSYDEGEGRFIARGGGGGLIKNPYHQMMRDHAETMSRIGSRFGFTPGDRANMKIEKTDTGPKLGAARLLS